MERNQECVDIACSAEMMGKGRDRGGQREGAVFASDHALHLESTYFVLFLSGRTVKTQYLT